MKLTLTKYSLAITALLGLVSADQVPRLEADNKGAPVFYDDWTEMDAKKSSHYENRDKLRMEVLDHNSRPVFGILTEPLRGDLY